jgi:aryl-alcohol dehydrogenase-like predicted oxidoreductase
MKFLVDDLTDKAKNAKVARLEGVAKELGCSVAQLAIAWCAANPHVSTVITGASRVPQVRENMGAAAVIPKLTSEVMAKIDAIVTPA